MTLETALGKVSQDPSSECQWGFWLTSVYNIHNTCSLETINVLKRIPSAALARTILRSNHSSSSPNKFSWVLVDAEHGFISDGDYYEVLSATSSYGPRPYINI
jgi:hypothetical protein